MVEISSRSQDDARPYQNLMPIVDLLLEHGNTVVDNGFLLNPDGWRCRMSRPLDLDLVRRRFVLPGTILISDVHDSILDQLSWCVIEGPGSRQQSG